jgi:transcriptional regulator with XRE-family HTH domain
MIFFVMQPRSPFHSHFGEAVKAIREKKKMTQAQVSGRMNVPATFLSDIERGIRNPSLSTLISLANALNVKLSAIVKRAGG